MKLHNEDQPIILTLPALILIITFYPDKFF